MSSRRLSSRRSRVFSQGNFHLPKSRVGPWFALAGSIGVFGCLLLAATAAIAAPLGTMGCVDPYNPNRDYFPPPKGGNIWFTGVVTGTSCSSTACNNVYDTQGGKGNISTEGQPVVVDDTQQHALEWMESFEYPTHCTSTNQTTEPSCWVLVGWEVGHSNSCGGTIQKSSPTVVVEIYDDSSNPCLLQPFGAAPTNASYDARFYGSVNGLHRYQVFFEVPGSNNIQDLAYADFKDQLTAEISESEADSGPDGLTCPVVGQTINGYWNYLGKAANQNTFASGMSLYTGSWQDWTSSVAPTVYFANAPYQLQPVSNFSQGNFTEWESGGPNG